MRNIVSLVVVTLLIVVASYSWGTDSPSAVEPTLDDLSWLEGSWYGEADGRRYEEHWTAASAGTMLCSFRLIVEDDIRVIEYVMISEEVDGIKMRFKHFRTDYTTWEADLPLEFTLIKASKGEAIFHSDIPDQHAPRRITYRSNQEGALTALVSGSDSEGRLFDKFELRFTRD